MAKKPPPIPFARKLVLNQWMLSLLGAEDLRTLASVLSEEALEGLDQNRIHRFHHVLVARSGDGAPSLGPERLLEYDQNIVTHTLRLNERRTTRGQEPIAWKYFQYLALLCAEIYLDHYFRDPEGLLAALNARIVAFNSSVPNADHLRLLDATAPPRPQLNKLAFWMATGSGKTLVMHANILQFQHYLDLHGQRGVLNRIILLTPNEGLSRQHLEELDLSGIQAEIFRKDGPGLFAGRAVEIIEITKLRDEMGDKTVAVDAFEDNNLVLIDEGHKGAATNAEGTWMRMRNALCQRGFSFEYSATFGQAIKGKPTLVDAYAKSILFDYSYRHFYDDGFGKDYQILNLDKGTHQAFHDVYLTACLLSFAQQLLLFRDQERELQPFQIEKPLWVFVGGSVTASLGKQEASDVIAILRFLARFTADRAASTAWIKQVLDGGLVTAKGESLFAGRFGYVNALGLTAAQAFEQTLALVFNAPGGGQLHVENLVGVAGEIALRIGGDNEPFGVINVGDDAKLMKLCEAEDGLATTERAFGGSLFHDIDQPRSAINLLIGSRKFTEGWSSWRVSTMGLMNIGKSEGAQIIQLFGRGVRLKGFARSLKRSTRTSLPEGVARPDHIGLIETLGVFGVHADYMARFRDFLSDEGLPANEVRIEFLLPVITDLGRHPLKTIRLKASVGGKSAASGDAFRSLAPVPTLDVPREATAYLEAHPVVLNWYPKVGALPSEGIAGGTFTTTLHEQHLSARHVAFLDVDALHTALERFKAERGWFNFNVPRQAIERLLADGRWYRLQVPPEAMAFDRFDRVRLWQDIALALLKAYAERFFTYHQRAWELPLLEYAALDSSDPNFRGIREVPADQGFYRIVIARSGSDILAKLEALKAAILRGELKDFEFQGLKAIWCGSHLYQPLLYLDSNVVEISPAPLNLGERRFVEDLKAFHDRQAEALAGRELYVLRNQSRGRGVGFFEAGNFHPDFILWLVADGRQHVVFVDPKGIRHIGPEDPKIAFHRTVKEIELRLGDPAVQLESFIVSNTPSHVMEQLWGLSKEQMEARHILFQDEDQATYIGRMLSAVFAGQAERSGAR